MDKKKSASLKSAKIITSTSFSDFIQESHINRSRLVVNVVSLFALISHIAFLFLFYFLKVYPMFIFNFFSVSLFGIIYFTFRRQKTFISYYIICATEVLVHQFFAVWFIGIESGFHYFILLMGLLPFLVLEDHKKLTVSFSLICGLVFMLIHILLDSHIPLYPINPLTITFIKTLTISFTILLLGAIAFVFTVSVEHAEKQAFEQYTRAEHLLCNILPDSIAEKLKLSDSTIAESYESVSVLFLDIVNFTQFSSTLSAEALVDLLNRLFSRFDILTGEHHVEKIKTIGDAYMVASGLPKIDINHCSCIADFALSILDEVNSFNKENHLDIQVRIGIHTGPVVAGIIGLKKFIYDLWGSTVNYASRMESSSEPNHIQVSQSVFDRLQDFFIFEKRDPMEIKGCGLCTNYFLIGKK